MATGVFGLRKVYIKQNENIDNRNFASWPESATYGYFGGGFTPPQINTITRLDFSNETVSDPGKNLPSSRLRLAAVSNSSYGYFGGGFIPVSTNFNIISRLDFSNETVSDPGKNLPASISDLAATSSSSYGYFGGGFPGPVINTISRIDFSSETVSLPGNNLPTSRRALATVSSSFYGYFGGALAFPSTTYLCTISRIDFSNETVSDPGKNLPTARGYLAATSSSYYGYFGGGYSINYFSTITRLDFSNETVNDPGNNLPTARSRLAAVSSSFCGYFGGGYFPTISTITRLDFSNETVSNPGKNLPTVRRELAAFSGGQSIFRGSKTYGYFAGGDGFPSEIITISRLDFSNETVSNPTKNLLEGRSFLAAVSNNSYGYFGGGLIGSSFPSHTSIITRLDFSNETVSNPGKNLPTARERLAAVSSGSYGYFGGGVSVFSFPGFWESTISRLDFSNESISNPGKNLYSLSPSGVSDLAVTSSNSYGYFGGGYYYDPSSELSNTYNTIVRLDFSNETISLPGKNLPSNRYGAEGVSNNFYGYFAGGGSPSINTITRLDFSIETLSLPTKDFPAQIISSAATSNNFYGYFGGGVTPGGTICTITRLDFSNETLSLPTKNLPTSRANFAAVSNSN